MALTNDIIKEKLVEKFGDQVSNWDEQFGLLAFESPKEMNLKVMQFLYDDEDLKFQFLTPLLPLFISLYLCLIFFNVVFIVPLFSFFHSC